MGMADPLETLPIDVQLRIVARAKYVGQHLIFEYKDTVYVAFMSGRIVDVSKSGCRVPGNILDLEREAESPQTMSKHTTTEQDFMALEDWIDRILEELQAGMLEAAKLRRRR